MPKKLTLHTTLNDTYHNEWDIWVYPCQQTAADDYVYARTYDEKVKTALQQGKKVLLIPENVKGRKTKFASHFWNPIMFNWNPMIVGTLIDSNHPAFGEFPTTSYADWQWWDILNYATAMELNDLTDITPIIQSIDTYEYNQKLGIAFEARIGKGSLFILCADPDKDIEKRPAMRQLLHSVKNYVASKAFTPVKELQIYQLDALFAPSVKHKKGNKRQCSHQTIIESMNIKSILTTCFVICAVHVSAQTPLYKQSSATVEKQSERFAGTYDCRRKNRAAMLSARMGNVYQNIQGCSAFRTI